MIPTCRGASGETVPEKFARIEDALAIHELTSAVHAVGLDCQIYNHDQEVPANIDRILICSPKANRHSANFYEDNKERLPFTIDTVGVTFAFCLGHKGPEVAVVCSSPYDGLHLHFSGASADVPSTEGRASKKDEDIGLICRWTEEGRHTFLLWGVHGVGTLAATRYVTNRSLLKLLVKEVGDRDFCVIIKASYKDIWHIDQASRYSSIFFRDNTTAQ